VSDFFLFRAAEAHSKCQNHQKRIRNLFFGGMLVFDFMTGRSSYYSALPVQTRSKEKKKVKSGGQVLYSLFLFDHKEKKEEVKRCGEKEKGEKKITTKIRLRFLALDRGEISCCCCCPYFQSDGPIHT
jgi:hypothetical protein